MTNRANIADMAPSKSSLRATYRVQLTQDFGFDEVASIGGYLAELGVSHVYLSPILQAAPGSSHGYDVVDHERVSAELGGIDAYQRMATALAEHGLRLVLDIVPNHMAIDTQHSRWWWDVLENGPSSLYADAFDVDWDPAEESLHNRVLVPILADSYGSSIEGGRIRLARNGADFVVTYDDRTLPVAPKTLDGLMRTAARTTGSTTLDFLADSYAALPAASRTDSTGRLRRHRHKTALREIVASLIDVEELRTAIDEAVEKYNGVDELDALLQRQNYRLAHWRVAQSELDYRRFFDVTTLVGLRIDRPEVFERTHAFILSIVGDGQVVDGLRVDHPDGLRDPAAYLTELSARVPDSWITVEKILARDEELPCWPVAGTTGYDSLDQIQGVLTAGSGEAALTELYRELTGTTESFDEIAEQCTRDAVENLLRPDLERLVTQFRAVCDRDRRWRDFGRAQLRRVLAESLIAMPVYRTYGASGCELRPADQAVLEAAIKRAGERCEPDDDAVFAALLDVLCRRDSHADANELAARFQQLSGAVRAKGIEDTAFYRYNRFVAPNEVGADPGAPALQPSDFHARNRRTLEHWPLTMVATSTHDTKRSEDVRARLLVLSEIPDEWAAIVRRWIADNDAFKSGGFPDRNLEYLLYQTIVGAHPISVERVSDYMIKAGREAKVHTSWLRVDKSYEQSLRSFVERICADDSFMRAVDQFVDRLEPHAVANSLAQVVLKLCMPGVPDIYQGNEVRTFALADPDNRRAVDFGELRSRSRALSADDSAWRRPELTKMWVTQQGLRLRAERASAFVGERAGYEPIEATGPHRANVVGFIRGGEVAVAVTRFSTQIAQGWGETEVPLPQGSWHDVFTARVHDRHALASELFADLPVVMLRRELAR